MRSTAAPPPPPRPERPTMRSPGAPPAAPTRPAPRALPPRRSITPTPATVSLADVTKLDAVRQRLNRALVTATTLGALRAALAQLSAELEDALAADRAPDTVRSYRAPWEGDGAPPTPRVEGAEDDGWL